jgi:putative transposase
MLIEWILIVKSTIEPLYPGQFYHIFNRGNNHENLFYRKANFIYFLNRYDYYLNEYLETYSYCLLPNHFHLLVRVKEVEQLLDLPGLGNLEGLISQQFSNFFNSYAKAINKQQNRSGSLFQKNFKRIRVDHKKYLANLVYYIHANPQFHGLVDDFRNWPYSSYAKFLVLRKTHLQKEVVLSWFGSMEEYRTIHGWIHDLKLIHAYLIEE